MGGDLGVIWGSSGAHPGVVRGSSGVIRGSSGGPKSPEPKPREGRNVNITLHVEHEPLPVGSQTVYSEGQ